MDQVGQWLIWGFVAAYPSIGFYRVIEFSTEVLSRDRRQNDATAVTRVLSLSLGGGRQGEIKRSALIHLALRPDAPSVTLDDPLDD